MEQVRVILIGGKIEEDLFVKWMELPENAEKNETGERHDETFVFESYKAQSGFFAGDNADAGGILRVCAAGICR